MSDPEDTLDLSESVEGGFTVNESWQQVVVSSGYLAAACMLARHAKRLEPFAAPLHPEERFSQEIWRDRLSAYQSYVTGAVFFCGAFLEASVNELYTEAAFISKLGVEPEPGSAQPLLARMWNLGIPRRAGYSLIERAQITLALADKEPLDTGLQPSQDVASLMKLRNVLVHYESEWVKVDPQTGESVELHELEKRIGNKFVHSPFFSKGPFLPDRCLSYGCAIWAIRSAAAFHDEFYDRLGEELRLVHTLAKWGIK